jgi:hypothetical protein
MVLDGVSCIDGAVVQDVLVDEFCHVVLAGNCHTPSCKYREERASFGGCTSCIINKVVVK